MENRSEYLLELYFSNNISKPELVELQNLVANDPAVASELKFQRQIAGAVQRLPMADWIQNKAWRDSTLNPSPMTAIRVNMLPKYFAAIAATIVLLIAAYIFLRPPNLQSVTADNFTAYPNKIGKTLGKEKDAIPPVLIQALSLYEDKKYREAALGLELLVQSHEKPEDDIRFYWGVALVADHQYDQAYKALDPLLQKTDSDYRLPAMYYIGLACAGKGDKACAKQNLQGYKDAGGTTFQKQAQKVLKAL